MPPPKGSGFPRREFLQLLGTTAGVVTVHAAGCGGGGKEPGRADGEPGDGSASDAASGRDSRDGAVGSDAEPGARDASRTDRDAGATPGDGGATVGDGGGATVGDGGDGGAAVDDGGDGGATVGDSGDGGATGDAGPAVRPPVNAEVLGEFMAALTTYANTLLDQTREQRRASLLAFLAGRAEVLASGVNDDGVWGFVDSGVPLMILDNREPDAPDPGLAPILMAQVSDVPKGTRARLVNTMGNAFVNEVPIVQPLFSAKGYSVVPDPGTVDSLRRLSGDGVFYFSAHGGGCLVPVFDSQGNLVRDVDGEPFTVLQFGIWTSTPFDFNNPRQYLADLQAGTLGLGLALQDYSADKTLILYGAHYWVTDLWAAEYWQFSRDALVWMSACQSHSAAASGLVDACLYGTATQTKASLYVGWSAAVRGDAAQLGAKFVLDRLLGANVAPPKETPPQRAFDVPAVWADLRKRGLHLHPNPFGAGTTELGYTVKPGSKLGLLTPSIEHVIVDEINDEAILHGAFGQPPEDERAVLIGGLEAQVNDWSENEIRVQLPASGTGSAGDVVVWVRGHDSNVRRITEWNIQFRYLWQDQTTAPCKVDGPVTVRFRADVGPYREQPGTTPLEPLRYAQATRDSQATLTASGVFTGDGCTTTYTGEANLGIAGYPESTPPFLISMLRVDGETKQAAIALALGAALPLPWSMRIACPGESTIVQPFAVAFGLLEEEVEFRYPTAEDQPGPTLTALVVQLTDAWEIPAGVFEEIDSDLKIRIEWDAVKPTAAPDPDAAC